MCKVCGSEMPNNFKVNSNTYGIKKHPLVNQSIAQNNAMQEQIRLQNIRQQFEQKKLGK